MNRVSKKVEDPLRYAFRIASNEIKTLSSNRDLKGTWNVQGKSSTSMKVASNSGDKEILKQSSGK